MSIDIFKRLLNGQAKVTPESEDQLFSPELPQTSWVCFDGSTLTELGQNNPQLWLDSSGWGSLKSIPRLADGRAIWVEYELDDLLRPGRETMHADDATAFAVAIQSVSSDPDKLSALVLYGGKKASTALTITAGFFISLDPDTGTVTDIKQTYSRLRDAEGEPVDAWAARRDLFFGLLPLMVGDQASDLGYGIVKRNARRFVPNLHSRDKKKRKAAQKQGKFHYYEVVPLVGVSNGGSIAGDESMAQRLEDTEE